MHSYLTVLLRNLRRERLYAAINIAGLSLGIACCLMLGLFLRSELTYDQHNVHYKQIYRVVAELATNGTGNKLAPTSQQLGLMLASVIAYFAIDEWLTGFAYKADVNPLVFLLSAVAAAAVAFTTVALQSLKTAWADPVEALRHV